MTSEELELLAIKEEQKKAKERGSRFALGEEHNDLKKVILQREQDLKEILLVYQ